MSPNPGMPDAQAHGPQALFDYRIPVWFFAWLVAFVVVVGTGLWKVLPLLGEGSRGAKELAVVVLTGFACLGFALAPWWLGIRCKRCRRRLRKAPTEPREDGFL